MSMFDLDKVLPFLWDFSYFHFMLFIYTIIWRAIFIMAKRSSALKSFFVKQKGSWIYGKIAGG